MLSQIKDVFQPRHLGLLGLVALAWVYILLFRYDAFGIEEAAALNLLINWSIIHQIASPVALFGVPDLRAIFFVPLDMYWAGSLPAAKMYTLFTLFATALVLYRWSERVHGYEAAMIATVLLLLSPLTLMQTDAIGSGIYMLFCFAIAGWLDKAFLETDKLFTSWYFLLVLITAMAVSMHPIGLAIPLVLGWKWLRRHEHQKKGQRLMIAIVIVTILMLLIRWGWYGMDSAASNPLIILSDVLLGSPLLRDEGWGVGLIVADVLLITVGFSLFRRTQDTLSLMLIAGAIIGLFHADHVWALIAWATTLYLGVPLLIEMNERFGWRGLLGQRGLTMVLVMIVATISMIHMRAIGTVSALHLKSGSDQIIAALEVEALSSSTPFMAASQWPARTLLACRRDVLPLPPAQEDTELFRKQTQGLTHFAFNPQLERLHALSRNAAALSDTFETLVLLPSGVVLKAKQNKNKKHNPS